MKNINRRKFINMAGCGAMGYTTLLNTLINLKSMNAASIANSAVFGSYKALVCLFLNGGNDSFNMLMPKQNNSEYETYAETRSNNAIPQEDILALEGSDYGLHPSLSGLRDLYNDGKVSFIANTGTLIEPIDNKWQIWDGSKAEPLGLYSHSDQSQQWQTSVPHDRTGVGWGGKINDLIHDMNSNQDISLNISLAGNNIFQTGDETAEYVLNPYSETGAVAINNYGFDWNFSEMLTQGVDNMIEANQVDLFKKTYVDIIKVSRDANLEFVEALEGVSLNTPFEADAVSMRLELVAKTIAARDTLGMTRQIFFVEYGGWDHHDEVLNAQTEMYSYVDAGLTSFQEAMEELGISDCVTTFFVSEFARTLTSNGNGTDHGWGGNMMVMGDAINGGQIFGTYPSLVLGSYNQGDDMNEIDMGGGVLIPSLSCDEYFAELALWFGVSPSDLNTIFPNIGNFYDVNSSDMPIGFLNL